jgi:hypothetical protein
MGFKSFLSAVGHDSLKVLRFLGSAQGQKDVQIAETAAVGVATVEGGPGAGAALSGLFLLVNKGLAGVLGIEATAAQLGAQSGTGIQKAAAVAVGVEPLAVQLLKDLGYDNPKTEQVESVTALVAKGLADIVNGIPAPAPAPVSETNSPAVEVAAAVEAAQRQAAAVPTTGMVSR